MTVLTRSGGLQPSIEVENPVAKRRRTSKSSRSATATITANAKLQLPQNDRNPPATPRNFPRQVQKKMGTLQRRPAAPPPVTPSTARRVPQLQQEAMTITKTVVDQQYSIEVVKIALSATISTIAWARKILGQNDHHYDFRSIDVEDSDTSYESFKNGHGLHPCIPRRASMEDLFLIRRGSHKAGDKLLDWLEIGAADALEKGYLKGLQLNFSSPEGFVEKYQIVIENTPDAPREEIGSLSFSDNAETTTMTTDLANFNLIALATAIKERMATSTRLPKGNVMTLDLWLNDNIPDGYNPLGFKIGNEEFVLPAVPSSLTMDTSCHFVAVHLSEDIHVQNTAANGHPQIEDPRIALESRFNEIHENENHSPATVEDEVDSRYDLDLDPLNLDCDSDEEVHTQVDRLERLEKIGTRHRPHFDTDRDTQRLESSQPRHVQTPKRKTMKEILIERMMKNDSAAGSSTDGTPSPPPSPLGVTTRKRSREDAAAKQTMCLSSQSPQVL